MVFPPLFGAENEMSMVPPLVETASYKVGELGIVNGVAWRFPDGAELPR